jgi:NitT/TauT family transport system substrate-binding protein
LQRRTLLTSLGALSISPWLLDCARKPPLEIGIHPWIGYETLYLARGFHWLPPSLRLQEGRGASELLAGLRAGKLDAACLTLDETLRARAEGIPLAVAMVFDASAGADAVLARPGIPDLAALPGRRLGVERNALGELMLAKVLEHSGLTAKALTVVDLPVNQQLAAWHQGTVDAVISFEPTCTLLMREGARVLFDSRQIPETIFDVLAVRRDRVRDRRAALAALVAGHFRGLSHLQTNRQDAIYRIAARQGVRPEEVGLALGGVLLPSLAGNHAYLAAQGSRLLEAARAISTILVRSGVLAREDTLDGLVSSAWLPQEGS